MFHRIKALAKKEIKQLLRDKRMLFVIFFFPVFLLVVFGYAVNFDVKNIKLAVYDKNHSAESRDFINTFTSSKYFNIVKYLNSDSEINDVLDTKKAQLIVIVPHDFSEKLYTVKDKPNVQFLIDGVDGNTAMIINNYIEAAVNYYNQNFQTEFLSRTGAKVSMPVDFRPTFWYNPDLDTTKFLIPGLIAMILIITAAMTVSLSLVREKEKGTIEQINVSSIKIIELLVGKAFPYLIIALINAGFILIAGNLMFNVTVKGSLILLLFSTLIFLSSAVSLGIFISVIADTQQIAFSVATFITLLPSMLLSGFVFPINNMPYIIQLITNLTPVKFFIIVLRAIILKGVGLETFWPQIVYLCLFTTIFLILAYVVQRKKELSA